MALLHHHIVVCLFRATAAPLTWFCEVASFSPHNPSVTSQNINPHVTQNCCPFLSAFRTTSYAQLSRSINDPALFSATSPNRIQPSEWAFNYTGPQTTARFSSRRSFPVYSRSGNLSALCFRGVFIFTSGVPPQSPCRNWPPIFLLCFHSKSSI